MNEISRIEVRVNCNAKVNQICVHEDVIEVQITVKPEHNKANMKVIELLSEYLHLPKSQLKIIQGAKNKSKVIEIVRKI